LSFVVILWYLPVHAAIMACLRCSCLRPPPRLSRSAPHTKCVVQLCGCCEVWCVRLPFVLKGGGAHRRAVSKPRARRLGCERVVMQCGVWCVGVWAVTATDTQSRKLHTNSLSIGITRRSLNVCKVECVSLKKIRLLRDLMKVLTTPSCLLVIVLFIQRFVRSSRGYYCCGPDVLAALSLDAKAAQK
jgi:hypothetical protein